MKKKISIMFLLIMVILLNTVVYATALNVDVTSNKEEIDVDEEIVITVDWKEGMQAADFILNYNGKNFEFVSTDIDNDLMYKVEDSKIRVVWFSPDDVDKTNMNFIFKAIKPGKSEFNVEIDGGFATGELVLPDSYTTGNTIVKVKGITTGHIISLVIAVIVLIIVCIFISKRTKNTIKRK